MYLEELADMVGLEYRNTTPTLPPDPDGAGRPAPPDPDEGWSHTPLGVGTGDAPPPTTPRQRPAWLSQVMHISSADTDAADGIDEA